MYHVCKYSILNMYPAYPFMHSKNQRQIHRYLTSLALLLLDKQHLQHILSTYSYRENITIDEIMHLSSFYYILTSIHLYLILSFLWMISA